MRGIVIAGTHSGCGKTTVTLGILAALRKRGLKVQPFKAGPDFIDAGLHRLVADLPSRNLDQWMCGPEYVIASFARRARGADMAVIEGVMGMYDGDRSTASLAALLGVPVVLVVDAYGMAESAGAVVRGFAQFGDFDELSRVVRSSRSTGSGQAPFGVKSGEPRIAGVIFNRVASEGHFQRIRDSVRDVPVLGYLPRELDFEIPHRHLGLTVAEENPIAAGNIERLADTVLRYIDIDAIIQSGEVRVQKDNDESHREGLRRAQSSRAKDAKESTKTINDFGGPSRSSRLRGSAGFTIAVAYDKAFTFYYEDNLDLLRDAGAEIIRFSPLDDPALPDADAVYIGGGYPEIHAEALSRNASMLASVRAWADAGKPLYAECGGLMYLSREIRNGDGASFSMAGVFPFATRMLKKPRLGYRVVQLREDCLLGKKGETCRGHEFHYSEMVDGPPGRVYTLSDSRGKALPPEGFLRKNTLASYVHVHFGSRPDIAGNFVDFSLQLGTAHHLTTRLSSSKSSPREGEE